MAGKEKKDNQKVKNNNGIQITPPDSNEKEKVDMCILCEKKPAYKTATVDSDLCADCRELFIKTPFGIKGFVALFFVIVLVLSGIMLVAPQFTTAKSTISCYHNINKEDYAAASGQISDMSIENIGWKTANKIGRLLYDLDTPSDLTYLVENFFYNEADGTALKWQEKVGLADLNAPWNKDLKAKYDYISSLNSLVDKHIAPFSSYYEKFSYGEITVEDIPYDELMKQYQTSLSQAPTNEEKGIISYCMFTIAEICKKDVNTQLAYCKNIMKYLPECRWYYIEPMITLNIQSGNYNEARKYIDIYSKTNPKYVAYAKRYNGILLRYEGKYDEAMKLFEELIADYDNNGINEVFYDALQCELIAGNFESAFEYAVQCYEYEMYSDYNSANLYYMLGKKLGKNIDYDGVAQVLEYYGMTISPTVDKYLKGEITTEDLFVNGKISLEQLFVSDEVTSE